MGYVRATGAYIINNWTRRKGDQSLSVRAGDLVPDTHWAVQGRDDLWFVPVGEDSRGTPMTEDQVIAALDEARARRDGIVADIAALRDSRSAGVQERREALQLGLERAEKDIADHELRLKGFDTFRAGGVEAGSEPEATAAARRDHQPVDRPRTGPAGEALEVLRRNRALGDELRDHVAALVEGDDTDQAARTMAAAADPDYASAFGKVARDPTNGHRSFSGRELAAWQRAEVVARALDLSGGAAMVPTHLDPSIMLSSDGSVDPMREISRTVTITTTTWNGVSSAGVTTRWAAEASQAGDDSPTLADPSVETHKADSFVPISLEALGDMANVNSELRRLFLDAKVQHEAPAFVTGSGSGQPQGLVTGLAAGQTVATAGSGAFASGDPYALLEALPPRFRANARWLANLGVIHRLDQFETSGGAKMFPQVGAAAPVLLRRRLHEHSELDEAITAGNHILIAGDFRHYVIVDRTPAAVELVPHLFGPDRRPTGQRGFYLWWRVGGAPVVNNAFRRLEVAA